MTVHITEQPDLATLSEVWPTLKDFFPRCKDCRWWDADADARADAIGVGVCRVSTIAIHTAGGVEIATRSYYGCVLWEARES